MDDGMGVSGIGDVATIAMLSAMVILTGFSACFSGSETALFGLDHAQRAALRRTSPARAAAVDSLLVNPRALLSTVLLGNVVVNTMYFAIGGALAVHASAAWQAAVLGVAQVVWLVTLGEVLPKTTAMILRERLAPAIAPPLRVLVSVTSPVRRVIDGLVVEPVGRMVGQPAEGGGALTRMDLVDAIAAGEESGGLSVDEELLLRRLMVHRQLRVKDVMTPRTELTWVSADASRDHVAAAARRGRVRRLVVCQAGDLDDVVGLLDVRVCLAGTGAIGEAIAPASFVPDVATLGQLDEWFAQSKTDLAVVVDEFGGTAGVVAVEDSLEQLVGDVVSRGEAVPSAPSRATDGTMVLDGRTSAADCAEALELTLPAMHASTVAGVAAEALGRMPRAGDSFRLAGHDWRILSVQHGRAAAIAVRRDDADTDTLRSPNASRGNHP